MKIARFLATRLLLGVLTLLVLSIITFTVTSVIPADPARVALGREATDEQLEIHRDQQGLNDPIVSRYVDWLGGFVQGDWGTSTTNRRPVMDDVGPKLSRTIKLAVISLLLAVPIAFLLGITTGQRSGGAVDLTTSVTALLL